MMSALQRAIQSPRKTVHKREEVIQAITTTINLVFWQATGSQHANHDAKESV